MIEPTQFGLNDLKLSVEMVRTLELPFGVVINRAVTKAQIEGVSVVEYSSNGIAGEIRELWTKLQKEIDYGYK